MGQCYEYRISIAQEVHHISVALMTKFVIFQLPFVGGSRVQTFVDNRKWLKWSLLVWAASVSFGQVYVGVHYPLDVICGGLLGSGIGWLGAFLYERFFKRYSLMNAAV